MDNFEEVYKSHFKRVYAFLYKFCKDPYLCEEMTQETFYQAFVSFHRYDGSCELFTWLCAIAKNTYFKYLRKNRIKTVDIDLYLEQDGGEELPDVTVSRRLAAERVKTAVSRLPDKYRDVVVLRIYADLPFAEIAKALSISENSAKVIFHRAKKILKEDLIDEH